MKIKHQNTKSLLVKKPTVGPNSVHVMNLFQKTPPTKPSHIDSISIPIRRNIPNFVSPRYQQFPLFISLRCFTLTSRYASFIEVTVHKRKAFLTSFLPPIFLPLNSPIHFPHSSQQWRFSLSNSSFYFLSSHFPSLKKPRFHVPWFSNTLNTKKKYR